MKDGKVIIALVGSILVEIAHEVVKYHIPTRRSKFGFGWRLRYTLINLINAFATSTAS